jgi:hypothetical protein
MNALMSMLTISLLSLVSTIDPIFKGLDNRNEVNDERINNLVKYIESIQAKARADWRDSRNVSPIAQAAR